MPGEEIALRHASVRRHDLKLVELVNLAQGLPVVVRGVEDHGTPQELGAFDLAPRTSNEFKRCKSLCKWC